MIGLNRKEKEKLVVDLYESGSNYREIAKQARVSLRDIKGILDKANGVHSLCKSSQAYSMFSEGKSPTDVAIALDMREPEVTQLYKESWTLRQLYDLNSIYLETKGDLESFVKLFKLSKAAGLTIEHIIKLLQIANNDLPAIEQKCHELKEEEAVMTAKNLNAARIFEQLSNDISEASKILEECRSRYRNEHIELSKLRIEKLNLDFIVKQFENSDEGYLKVKDMVRQEVELSLSNYRDLLNIALLSIIDSCRNNPEKFNTLYHSLSIDTGIMWKGISPSGQSSKRNYVLSTDQQLYCGYNSGSDIYHKFLLDEAEQLFNKRIKELTQVCISLLAGIYISTKNSSQLTRNSYGSSEIMPIAQNYENWDTN
jgi:hypothetical protein